MGGQVTLQIIYPSSRNECIKTLNLHFLFNRCTSMLTGVWHARLRRDIWAVWMRGRDDRWIESKTCCLFLFCFVFNSLFSSPQGCFNATQRRWIFAQPETNCFSVPHLLSTAPRAVYASVTPTGSQQKWWTRTPRHCIYLLKSKCLFLYVLKRTSTPPTTRHVAKGEGTRWQTTYLARGCICLGLELIKVEC